MFDNQILQLHKEDYNYPQIAIIMGESIDTIKNAAYIKTRKAVKRACKGGKPGRRPIDWQAMDDEMLPKVVETMASFKSSEKPQRITVGRVARLTGLKPKQIDKLILCKAEIERNCQTQERFWAEKVLWAWNTLLSQGKVISVKQIRTLTNMSANQIIRAMPELKKINRDVYEELLYYFIFKW